MYLDTNAYEWTTAEINKLPEWIVVQAMAESDGTRLISQECLAVIARDLDAMWDSIVSVDKDLINRESLQSLDFSYLAYLHNDDTDLGMYWRHVYQGWVDELAHNEQEEEYYDDDEYIERGQI